MTRSCQIPDEVFYVLQVDVILFQSVVFVDTKNQHKFLLKMLV